MPVSEEYLTYVIDVIENKDTLKVWVEKALRVAERKADK